ncbi:MAG: anti-sigma factor antagonist [Acidobacteria bacterium]|nr:MAG: anti-sigma factor antagonist [Acidobacteriota bacterium]REK00163.1 MAG: anti-sigma factor antagonist [Acidobacteriota bacterium]
MNLSTHQAADSLVVHLHSPRLDAAHTGAFRARMAELVAGGHRRVVVDLSEVDFVDSSGLSALIATLKLLDDGRELMLAGPSPPVQSLLKLTRFDRILRIYADPAEAIAAA